MKKKYIILIILVIIFQTFSSGFLYVEASNSDNSICAWPSETMSLYFDFQNEMRGVLLGSSINERRFKVSMWKGWLFSEQVLNLPLPNALDLVASSVRNGTRSVISNAATTAVLILLTTVSVVQSNTEWLAILFRDRPIVRDYKTMLDIESALFDVAYFRSKQINLTRPVDGNMVDQFNEVVKKYQDLWLLDEKATSLNGEVSMSHVIWDLVWMNAAMKHFIVYDAGALKTFYGCMNKSKDGNCNPPILKFSDEAISKLKNDYRWTFGKCNHHFNSLVSKATKDSFTEWWKDVENAIQRLVNVMLRWEITSKSTTEDCDISDYELAQIRSYRGNDWSCNDYFKLKKDLPYINNDTWMKKVKQELRKQGWNTDSDLGETSKNKIDKKQTTSEKMQERFAIYWGWTSFNPEYSSQMDAEFLQIYYLTKNENNQSEWNVQASNLSSELIKIRWLIDQLDRVIEKSDLLDKELEKIVNYQCAN